MMFKFCSCAFLCAFILFSSSHVACEDIATENVEAEKRSEALPADLKGKSVSETTVDESAEKSVEDLAEKGEFSEGKIDVLEKDSLAVSEIIENADILDNTHDTSKIDEPANSQNSNSSPDADHLGATAQVSQKKDIENPADGDLKVESREEGILEIDSNDSSKDDNKKHADETAETMNSDEAFKDKILKDIIAIGANQMKRKNFAMDDEGQTTPKIAEDMPSTGDALVAVNVEADAPSYDKLVPVCGWNRYSADSAVTLKQWVRWWKYLRMKQPVVMSWLNGLILRIYPGNEVYRALYVRGIYDPNFIIAVNSLLHKGGTFIDAGASIGHFSLLASGVVGEEGHVIAVEPSSRDYSRLVDNIKINGLENIISPYRFAISDVNEGVAKLSIACEERSSLNTTGSEFSVKGVDEIQVEDVNLATLDSFVANSGISRIEMLKLDIEGSELRALKGAVDTISRFRPSIMIGVNASSLKACGATREEIQKFMQGFRYRMYKITYSPRFEFALVDDISKNHSKVLFCFHESVIPPSLPQPENKSIMDYIKDFFTK